MTLLVFGVIGIIFKSASWPRPPIILGLVLGPIMENNLDLSLQVLGWGFLVRPLVIAMIVILALSFAWEFRRLYRMRKQGPAPAGLQGESEAPQASEAKPSLPASLFLLIALGALCAMALYLARNWSSDASMFPNAIAALGLVMIALALSGDIRTWRIDGLGAAQRDGLPLTHAVTLMAWLAGVVAATMLFGQLIALPLMVAVFLIFWGRENWKIVAAQAFAAWLVLYVIFERFMNVIWHQPLIGW